jgi:hypothetical protein
VTAARQIVDRPDPLAGLLWLVAVGVGFPLRFVNLMHDTPTLDEYHPLWAVSQEGFLRLLSTFGLADRSIPVALYLESLSRTLGIDPLTMRLPFIAAGAAGFTLLPVALRSWIGPLGAAALAAALSTQPMFVYYSRTIRPYGIVTMLLILAIFFHHRWMSSGERRFLGGYALLAAGGVWALPLFAPFAAGAPLVSLVQGLRTGHRLTARRALCAAACGGGLAVVLLSPALIRDLDALRVRAQAVEGGNLAVAPALRVLVGNYWAGSGLVVLTAAAFATILLRRRSWLSLLLGSAALQTAAVVAAAPLGIDEGRILARYLLPSWLALMIATAALLSEARRAPALARWLAALGLLAWVAAPFVRGPLRGWLRPGPDNFASDRLYERLEFDRESRRAESLSPNYRRLAELPAGSARVLEVPFFVYVPRSIPELQFVHRQPVHLAVVRGFCSRRRRTLELPEAGIGGFELKAFLALGDLESLRAAGVRFVMFHREDETRVDGLAERHYFYDFDKCIEAFGELSGAPSIDDGYVVAFDLSAAPLPGSGVGRSR